MNSPIRIGTRDSALALYQALLVEHKLNQLGYHTKLVPLKAQGDTLLDKPLYQLGITGVFTRHLDQAMLNGRIDIAVHSMKDVPTKLARGIVQAAVLERANTTDILVYNDGENPDDFANLSATIATSSLRRKAQWLARYPQHRITDLRGNVQTRLNKLAQSSWQGAIFAAAGLERINLRPHNSLDLDWMLPAPAQGAIMITAREQDSFFIDACAKINHKPTALCTKIEREFLSLLEGGCTAPIGALATIDEPKKSLLFRANVTGEDGKESLNLCKTIDLCDQRAIENLARSCVDEIKARASKKLLSSFYKQTSQPPKVRIFSTKKLSDADTQLFPPHIELESEEVLSFNHLILHQPLSDLMLDTIIFSSCHAVTSIIDNATRQHFDLAKLAKAQVYCVGKSTETLLKNHGIQVVYSAHNAHALGEYLQKHQHQSYRYFAGNRALPDLGNALGEKLHTTVVYTTQLKAYRLNSSFDALLFFSPSAVESFCAHNAPAGIAFCLGKTTAWAASQHFAQVIVAKTPDKQSLFEQVIAYFTKQP